MFRIPNKNEDLRHVDSGLTERERREAIQECARLKQREMLGERWIGHLANAPVKGSYNPLTGRRLT